MKLNSFEYTKNIFLNNFWDFLTERSQKLCLFLIYMPKEFVWLSKKNQCNCRLHWSGKQHEILYNKRQLPKYGVAHLLPKAQTLTLSMIYQQIAYIKALYTEKTVFNLVKAPLRYLRLKWVKFQEKTLFLSHVSFSANMLQTPSKRLPEEFPLSRRRGKLEKTIVTSPAGKHGHRSQVME